MTDKPFFVARLDMFQAAGDTQEYEFAHAATPHAAWTLKVEPLESTGALYISDDGYTTKSTDLGGVRVYPPKIAASFAIDRQVPLLPGDGAGSWGFGSLEISDIDGEVSSLLRSWNIDAQNVDILRGVKTFEAFDGYKSMRQTSGWYINVDGELTEAAAQELRWDYSTGTRTLLNEAASTNYVANPRAEGASAGTPGTAPTGWTVQGSASGITRTIVGVGTEDGIPYIEIRYAGTASPGVNRSIGFVTTSSVAASVGQVWTSSAYVKLVAGSVSGITSVSINQIEAGGSSAPNSGQIFVPTGAALPTQRVSTATTIAVADTTNIQGRVLLIIPNGGVVDITLRIGAPQMELAAAATSVILPEVSTPAVTSRDMERLYTARNIWVGPPLSELSRVFTGLSGTWVAGDDKVTIPIRDASYWLDQPILSAVYGGTGTYDGTAEIAGTAIPKTRGKIYNITPVLIDPTNLIYQYSDGPGAVVALYERGATGASGIVFQADTTDLYTGTTTAGEYRTDDSRGLFQLGSPPVGQITIDATGEFPVGGAFSLLANIARVIATEDAGVPTDYVDVTAFSDLATAYPYPGGIHIGPGNPMTGRQAVAYLLSSMGAKLNISRNGELKPLLLRAESISATPVAALGEYNTIAVRAISLPAALSPPPYRIRVGYQHNYTVQQDISDLATAARREFIQQADRYAAAANTATLAAYRRPNDLPPFGGGADLLADATDVAQGILDLWSVHRRFYSVTVPMEVGLSLDLGDTVLLTWPTSFLRLGQRGLIVQEQFRSQEDITFGVLF